MSQLEPHLLLPLLPRAQFKPSRSVCECRGVVAGDVAAVVRCVEAVLVKKIIRK